jgi:hypothetical protein
MIIKLVKKIDLNGVEKPKGMQMDVDTSFGTELIKKGYAVEMGQPMTDQEMEGMTRILQDLSEEEPKIKKIAKTDKK